MATQGPAFMAGQKHVMSPMALFGTDALSCCSPSDASCMAKPYIGGMGKFSLPMLVGRTIKSHD